MVGANVDPQAIRFDAIQRLESAVSCYLNAVSFTRLLPERSHFKQQRKDEVEALGKVIDLLQRSTIPTLTFDPPLPSRPISEVLATVPAEVARAEIAIGVLREAKEALQRPQYLEGIARTDARSEGGERIRAARDAYLRRVVRVWLDAHGKSIGDLPRGESGPLISYVQTAAVPVLVRVPGGRQLVNLFAPWRKSDPLGLFETAM